MYEGFQVIAVADLRGRKWALQQPIPSRPESKIHKMLRINDVVEVFAIPTASGGAQAGDRALHETLLPPHVAIVIECALTTHWSVALAGFPELPERIDAVYDALDRVWERGKTVPVDPQMRIERIEARGERIEIFAVPDPNTDWARNGINLLFTLMPLTLATVIASAPMQAWNDIMRDREEEAFLGDDDADPEEPEPEPQPVPAAGFTPPPAVPMPGGPSPSPLEGIMPSSVIPSPPNGQQP